MDVQCLRAPSDIRDIYRRRQYLKEFLAAHPDYFNPIGTMIFCGKQGKGKTLSAVKYVKNVLQKYPKAVLVSNVAIKEHPFNTVYRVQKDGSVKYFKFDNARRVTEPQKPETLTKDKSKKNTCICYDFFTKEEITLPSDMVHSVQKDVNVFEYYDLTTAEEITLPRAGILIEYDGLDSLKYVSNGFCGVIYLIDELHLELNSLESKNIDIDVMTEISQQRKQRKHIVGTSQVYMRLAKPLREQIFNVVLCDNLFFKWLQYNKLIDGEESKEVDGKFQAVVRKRVLWIHKPEDYQSYDTFAKMKRYNKEWQGHKREDPSTYKNSQDYVSLSQKRGKKAC